MDELHSAAARGDTKAVKLLLDRGADVNALDLPAGIFGVTPLHLASDKGHTETVRLLIDRGADIQARHNYTGVGRNWETPLHCAASGRHVETVKLLLTRLSRLCGPGKGASHDDAQRLYWATGSAEVVKLLLDKGAKVNARLEAWTHSLQTQATSLLGATALHHAAEHGESETVKLLVDRGADVNVKNYSGVTPLHLVVTALARIPASTGDVVKRYTKVVAILKARGGSPAGSRSTKPWWRRVLGR